MASTSTPAPPPHTLALRLVARVPLSSGSASPPTRASIGCGREWACPRKSTPSHLPAFRLAEVGSRRVPSAFRLRPTAFPRFDWLRWRVGVARPRPRPRSVLPGQMYWGVGGGQKNRPRPLLVDLQGESHCATILVFGSKRLQVAEQLGLGYGSSCTQQQIMGKLQPTFISWLQRDQMGSGLVGKKTGVRAVPTKQGIFSTVPGLRIGTFSDNW